MGARETDSSPPDDDVKRNFEILQLGLKSPQLERCASQIPIQEIDDPADIEDVPSIVNRCLQFRMNPPP